MLGFAVSCVRLTPGVHGANGSLLSTLVVATHSTPSGEMWSSGTIPFSLV